MGSKKALRSMVLTAVAALLGAAWAGPAAALPVPIGEGEDTDCLARAGAGDAGAFNDAVNGNFWARRDIFSVDVESDCGSAFVSGISVFVKTPFQVDSVPEWNDLDGGNNSLPDLTAAMRALPEADGFHPSFTGLGFTEANGGAPTGAFANTFVGVRICLTLGTTTVAGCLAGSPMVLTDIGGGYMIFTIDLGEDSFFLDAFEGDDDFQLVTIVHSDVLGPVPGNDLPELLVGWRFVGLENMVPEPAPAWLLVPALLLVLRRRAS
jgi:hypothetical protein